MALQGTIETFALPEVLRLLGSGGKTGRLRVSGDRGSGSVWIDGGKVVAAEATGAPEATSAVSVVFELLRFAEGSFNFDDDQATTQPGTPQDVEVLLGEAERQLAEWQEIEAVIPSLDVRIALADTLPTPEVVIDAHRWCAIVAIAGGETVGAIASALELDELAACGRAKELVEDGLVVVVEVPPAPEFATETEAPVVDEIEATYVSGSTAPEWEPTGSAFVDDTPAISAPVTAPTEDYATTYEPAPEAATEARSAARAELDAMASGFGLTDPVSTPTFDDPMSDGPLSNGDGFDRGFASDPSEDPAFSFAAPDADSEGHSDFASMGTAAFPDEPLAETPSIDAALFAEDVVPPPSSPPAFGMGSGDALFAPGTSGFDGDHDAESGDAAEVARQLANLSPKAARAVAAAARASTVEEREAALAEVTSEGNEPINRGLLLKFLSSVQT